MLPTAIIGIFTESGDVVKCRALLDSGSQSSFITEHCSQALRLKRHPEMLNLTGIGNNSNQVARASVDLNFKSMINDKQFQVKAFILPKVTGKLPTPNKSKLLTLPKTIQPLADTDYSKSQEVDVILGADIYEDIALNDKFKSKDGLNFRKTEFGWVISGRVADKGKSQSQSYHIATESCEFNLKKF